MTKATWAGIAILFAFSGTTSLRGQESPGGEFAWKTDLGKARAEAKASGKPLLVVFR